ncbi:MAG: hypothetical protein IKL60_03815 [Alistipes sp.]|nr:hypothetical protein [Alistipes sp.]
MIELIVDGQVCDLGDMPTLPLNFDAESLTDVEGGRSGRTVELNLRSTPKNDTLFGASCDLYAAESFNARHHSAVVVEQGLTLFAGTLVLLATEVGSGYKVRIVAGGCKWIDDAVSASLDDLPIDFQGKLTLTTIENSWESDSAVRFLPVYRGDYNMSTSSHSTHPVEHIMLSDDFHPFISVAEMVRSMFAGYGYTLKSDLLDSDLFASLYMSGDYTRSNLATDSAKCDFLARRAAPITATADSTGRVYSSTAFASHTLGNIVDTANPNAIDSEGNLMSDTFSTNGCFTTNDDGQIVFKPVTSVNVGFVLHAEYTTDYKIATRERLFGFDVFEGLNGVYIEYALNNAFKDYRRSISPNTLYRAVVFNHIEGYEYRLVEKLKSNVKLQIGLWASRSAQVLSASAEGDSLNLYYRAVGEESWQPYTDDWALYAGHVEEEGQVDVECTVRIPPQEVNRGEELILDKFWFGGAESGMSLTLGTGTSLRPYFTNVAGYGSTLTYADIAPKQVRQIDLLRALAQMFNLAFITDEERKVVRMEPLEDAYKGGKLVDWTSRIDFAQPIMLCDTGIDRPQDYILSYIDADRASHLYNLANDTTLGSWAWRNPLYGTTQSTKRIGNRLFTTTLNAEGVLGCAPSASLLQVGDVTLDEAATYGEFTHRIVSYRGLISLPSGENWNGKGSAQGFPYATFIDGDSGINLCFEEREGVEGLARYYKEAHLREECRQRLSLTLQLTPAEIVHLTKDDGHSPSVLDRYRFTILGESAIFRLVQIEAWDPLQMTVKCVFQRELVDGYDAV